MAPRKKRLLLVVPHMPAFDSCIPLMIRLHQRGNIDVKVILGPRLRKVEPRAEQVLQESGIAYANRSTLGMELFCIPDFLRADAILTHSDPIAFGGKFRPRDSYAMGLKKPMIFVQHGMVQTGLQLKGEPGKIWDYYADTLLIWAPLPDPDAPFLAPSLKDRLHITGITKQNLLGPWHHQDKIAKQFDHYSRKVLICHNFGFEPTRYSDAMFEAALKTWKAAALAHPDVAFILRSHRGKRHADIETKVGALCDACPNIIRSERHQGLTTMATIHDVMAVVDCVISHPSTVILDAVYDGKPVAVMNGFQSAFDHLTSVDELADFNAFIDDPAAKDSGQALREIYGDIASNLDKAAQVIEDRLNTA